MNQNHAAGAWYRMIAVISYNIMRSLLTENKIIMQIYSIDNLKKRIYDVQKNWYSYLITYTYR